MNRAFLFWLWFVAACGAQAVTLEELAASPERWPAEITVTASARGVVLKDGQPNGAMLLGAGRVLALTGVGPEGVTGRLGSTVVRLPVEKTDLLARLGQPASAALEKPAPSAPTVPVEATRTRPISPVQPTALQQILASRLIVRENNAVRAFDSRRLNGVKFFGLYFSASWCGPCREFTPELIKDYAAIRELYPEFEIVLVSADRSEV
ncbi:MAG: thioredoxin-like domain-containing protein, partial [Candidatus Didemnitutus sp.]|nr:thioredoxin-like domain-containing protein [Candidatus Didemnitutus sp.]